MKRVDVSALHELARLYGVQTSYLDVSRRRQEAQPQTLSAVLQALDPRLASGENATAVMHEKRLEPWRRAIEPVQVAWNGTLSALLIRLPMAKAGRIAWRVELESGQTKQRVVRLDRLQEKARRRVEGITHVSKEFGLNLKLPPGYHKLTVETPAGLFRSLVLSAPAKVYSEKERLRIWGAFVPLYALRSGRNWGSGDFGTLQELIEWLASLGGSVAATLPILPAFLNEPFEPGPYSPVSRLFWNEFYIDPAAVPEFQTSRAAQQLAGSSRFQGEIAILRGLDAVDYRREMALKRQVLEKLADEFFTRKHSSRWSSFRQYLREHPLAEDYAAFRAATERRKESWPNWPERMREGDLRPGDSAEPVRQFHLYAQWIAHEQVARVASRARELGSKFYLDLPLGVNGGGYDVWRRRDFFAMNVSGGAPPDVFFTKGQNWGFSPLHPHRMREAGYSYVIDYLRHHLRRTQMLRIDHCMALHRLYWVPQGMPSTHGAYVRYNAGELYAILAIESHRHRAMIVGENLGTVPPEVNRAMERRGMRRMFVVQYEQRPAPKHALRPVPERSVSSLNTHDMPPFNAWWRGLDIEDRIDLGLIRRKDRAAKRKERQKCNDALAAFLRRRGVLAPGQKDAASVLRACLAHLSRSATEVVLVTLEDLWLETKPQNVPGTTGERVNWRRKTRHALEEIQAMPEVLELLRSCFEGRR